MTPEAFLTAAILPAFRFLDSKVATKQAAAMLLTIGQQESDLQFRKQRGGPAKSYLQFEVGGISGICYHPTTTKWFNNLLLDMDYRGSNIPDLHTAIEYDAVLACALGRLLLWTDAQPLPGREDAQAGWDYYARTWRPGMPHREKWNPLWERAWNVVEANWRG